MDEDGGPRARGWKRYLARRTWDERPQIPANVNDKVKTKFTPLAKGTRFEAQIRVHNLRPAELGALLWAIEFGGSPEALHTIGQARPLGYGMVRMKVKGATLRSVRGDDGIPSRTEMIDRFRGYMEAECSDHEGGWARSLQITELIAMATPLERVADEQEMRYLRIEPRNEFGEFKTAAMVLPLHGGPASRARTEGQPLADPAPDETGRGVHLLRVDDQAPSLPAIDKGTKRTPVGRALEPSRPPPTPQPGPSRDTPPKVADVVVELPDTIQVRFANVVDARARRKTFEKQRAKKKVKAKTLRLEPIDPAVASHPEFDYLELSTTETEGVVEVFEALRQAPGPIQFSVERPTAGHVVRRAFL